MNSTTIKTTYSEDRVGFPLKFGLSLGFLALVALGFIIFCLLTRKHVSEEYENDDFVLETTEEGRNEKIKNVILSFPTMLYSEAKLNKKFVKFDDNDEEEDEDDDDECNSRNSNSSNGISCCSICLSDYKDSDLLRLLPDCYHFFHLNCIDLWLKHNNTCPICRKLNNLLPVANQVPPVIMDTRRELSSLWFVPFVR